MAKTTTLLACTALAILFAAPGTADAGPKQNAKVHIDRATKAHKAGDLETALTELQAAYAIDPQPQLLYAIGQIYTKLGRCSEASDAYLRYLASGTDANTAQVVKQAIDSCKGAAATEPAPPAKDPPPPTLDNEQPPGQGQPAQGKTANAPPKPVEPSSQPEPQLTARGTSPWYSDVLGDVLVLGGVTSLVLGSLAYRAAVTDLDNAEVAPSHERYEELVDAAKTKRLVGIALWGGGAVLVTAGVLRFALRDNHTEIRRVGLSPARGGGLLTWTRSF
ncbi:MAG TPA: hypothetical protein VNO30_02185 [Kofleriaceae bacterium]|nr:hypothetical protein [Kofleriaceae bacterium]